MSNIQYETLTPNDLAAVVHVAHVHWWQDLETGKPLQRDRDELLMLVVSELSEAVDAERKGDTCMDSHLPHRRMAEVEMADAKIRLLDFFAGFGLMVDLAIEPNDLKPNRAAALFDLVKLVTEAADYLDERSPELAAIVLSKVLVMIDAYCAFHGYDLAGAFREKMAYNADREDHKHEARRIAGGKQF